MDLIQTPNKQFVDGDRRTPGTPVPAWWLNQLQGELSAVVAEAGLKLDKNDQEQVVKAIKNIAERQGKGILDNAPLVIYAKDRAEFVAKNSANDYQSIPDGAIAIAEGAFYQRAAGAKKIADLTGWLPARGLESIGNYRSGYDVNKKTAVTIAHKRDGSTVADIVSIKNPKINTLRKVFADRSASSYGRKTPREFARQNGYKVVINADGWAKNNAHYGLQIENGQVVQDWAESPAGTWNSAIVFMGDGSLKHAKRSDGITAQQWVERGALWSVCFAGVVVEDGRKVINTSSEIANAVSARTIIGQKADGELIIIMVEGQSDKYGMTLDQAADYAIAQGCLIAYAADGGGSTQCWWGDCYAVPSSDGNFMTERALSAFLVIDADVAQYDTGYIPLPLAEKMTSSKPAGGVTFRQVGKQINVEIECESSFTANKVTALCTTVPLRYRTARLTEMKGIAVGAAGIIGGIFAGATHLSVNMLSETSYVAGNFGWTAINSN